MVDPVAGPERLRVYQLAREFTGSLDGVVGAGRISLSLADQLRRAGDSVLLNIAEGAGHFSPGRKLSHYQIARASATECIAILTRLHDRAPTPALRSARQSANLICKMLTALIKAQEERPRR